MWEYNNLEELYHHGILGMKWGVRKNRRYTSKDYRRIKSLRKKKVNQMSNKELQEINKRMELENKYSKNKSARNPISKASKTVIGASATLAAGVALHKFYQEKGKLVVKKFLGGK